MAQMPALTDLSGNFEQFISYECLGSLILGQSGRYGAWESGKGIRMKYWGDVIVIVI